MRCKYLTITLKLVIPYFDIEREGKVDFEDFLIGIRGKPNSRRQAIIDKAYLRFDKDGSGYISVKDVR